MKIGVFDSGVGGKSFVDALSIRFPDAEIIYKDDKENVPYGDKSPAQLMTLTLPIFKQFESEGCDAVLVACNTITTNIIQKLRSELSVPLVGVEPMIKPAANMTKTANIAVCATPATLRSERYAWLKREYGSHVKITEPDTSNWAYMIENNRKNELKLKDMIEDLKVKNVDVLVLGCTHYHWIEKELKHLAGNNIHVIQPTKPVIDQLERVVREN